MSDQSPGGWSSSRSSDDDAWGPSTAVYSGSATPRRSGRDGADPAARPPASARPSGPDAWSPAGPVDRDKQRANRQAERSIRELQERQRREQRPGRAPNELDRPRERGLPWWAGLLILIAIAVLGGVIDTAGSTGLSGAFNIGIVVASIVGILVVKRSHMFPIVIAPPIVYSLAAVFQLYLRSGGLHDKKVVLDAASNYLVYGFPAIAAATAAVLIIAGIRLITRK